MNKHCSVMHYSNMHLYILRPACSVHMHLLGNSSGLKSAAAQLGVMLGGANPCAGQLSVKSAGLAKHRYARNINQIRSQARRSRADTEFGGATGSGPCYTVNPECH